MSELDISNLNKYYGSFHVLKSVSLKAEHGSFVTLVGPSGCGKSTLLKVIAGLETFDAGSLKLDNRNIASLPPKERDMAMVFQEYSLYPHMDVRANLSFALRVRRYPKSEIEQRVNEAAEMLQITHLLNKKVHALSGGQKQRVAIGRAIVRRPKVFLLDEPLSNLDAKLRSDMRRELKHLHKKLKVTTIYVTHDQLEAMNLSDKVVVIRDGVIQQCDTPLGVYLYPTNRFVAQFIGYPPMNFIDVAVDFKAHRDVWHLMKGTSGVIFETGDPRLKDFDGKVVTLGIRPEDISLRKDPNQIPMRCQMLVSENSGSVITLDCNCFEGTRLLIQTSQGEFATAGFEKQIEGDQVNASFQKTKLHYFDPKTEKRIDAA